MVAKKFRTRTSSHQRKLTRESLFIEQLESRTLLAGLWSYIGQTDIPSRFASDIRAEEYKLATLDFSSIQSQLALAPMSLGPNGTENSTIEIPKPDGTFETFSIYATSIMAPELAARYPEIRTYAGQGVDDPASTVFFDLTPQGFHAQVRSPAGTYYVDPYSTASTDFYAVYAKVNIQMCLMENKI